MDHFPVALQRLAHIHDGDHFFELVRSQQLDHLFAEELGQRFRILIGIEENESGKGVDRYFQQAEFALVDRADEIRACNTHQTTVEAIRPEMVGAGEATVRMAGFFATEHIAAMAAGVDEAANFAVVTAHDHVGLIVEVVEFPVAIIGQLSDATGFLPDF